MGFSSCQFAPSLKAVNPLIKHVYQPKLLSWHRPSTAFAAAGSQPQPFDDPVEAMLWAASQQSDIQVQWADPDEDQEELAEMLEDLEDVWMRNPAGPEWLEPAALSAEPVSSSAVHGSSAGNNSGALSSSRGVASMSWEQLQQQLGQLHQQQQLVQTQHWQEVVILQVSAPPGDSAHQGSNSDQVDPPSWAAGEQQASQGHIRTPWQQSQQGVKIVQILLADITRDVADAWQDKLVAVVDTGHHSCLAAAIRLTAVYRLPHVVLLQEHS